MYYVLRTYAFYIGNFTKGFILQHKLFILDSPPCCTHCLNVKTCTIQGDNWHTQTKPPFVHTFKTSLIITLFRHSCLSQKQHIYSFQYFNIYRSLFYFIFHNVMIQIDFLTPYFHLTASKLLNTLILTSKTETCFKM